MKSNEYFYENFWHDDWKVLENRQKLALVKSWFLELSNINRDMTIELVDEEERAKEMVADTDATPGNADVKAAQNNAAADQIYATIDDATDEKYLNYTEQKEILINSVKQASDMAFGQNPALV